MSKVFTLGRATGMVAGSPPFHTLHNMMLDEISDIQGFLSSTVWQPANGGDGYLVLNGYQSLEAANEAQLRVTEGRFLAEAIQNFSNPLDIRQCTLVHQDGTPASGISVGQFMSLSDRSADPGLGPELETEIANIFGELKSIEGYLGSIVGHSLILPEEVIGLVFWDQREAFEQSLPRKVLYEVKLFQRIR